MPYDDLLTQKATLERATIVRDPSTGDEDESWAEMEKNVPCLVTRLRMGANPPIGLLEGVTNVLHFKYRTDLQTGRWRAIVNGVEYRLVDYNDPGDRHHHIEMAARRMS